MLSLLVQTAAFSPSLGAGRLGGALRRSPAVSMDETLFEKALAGELEQEGAENLFLSEVGWATYMDEACGSSYAMNPRPSQAEDGYFTSSILSNPLDGARSRRPVYRGWELCADESGIEG